MSTQRRLVSTLIALLFLALGAGPLLADPSDLSPELTTDAADAAAADSWPILRYDSGHSGYNADVGSFRPPLARLDSIELQDVSSDPHPIFNIVTGPERIYAAGNGIIWGVDKEDPSVQWRNDDCIADPLSSFCIINS